MRVREMMEGAQPLSVARSMWNGETSTKGKMVKRAESLLGVGVTTRDDNSGDEEAESEPGAKLFSAWRWKVSEKSRWQHGERKREVEQDTRASQKQEGFAGGCPGSHREGQGNSSLSSGLRDKLPKELKFHLLEKVQGKQRFGGHPGFIRKSHGKQTFQKSPEIKEEFDDHKLKIQRAQWKADFVFLFVNGAGRELTGACVETRK